MFYSEFGMIYIMELENIGSVHNLADSAKHICPYLRS